MKQYDILLMFPATLKPDDVTKIAKRLFDTAAPKGLEVESMERWPKRRFAYEVKHHTEGYYCQATFRANPEGLNELDRLCRLEDSVLRHKITTALPTRSRKHLLTDASVSAARSSESVQSPGDRDFGTGTAGGGDHKADGSESSEESEEADSAEND